MPEPMTVAAVRLLAGAAGKDWAVVISGDDAGTQYVTWGRAPEHKVLASDLAEDIAGWVDMGGTACLDPSTGPVEVLESFKLDAARNKARVEELEAEVARLRKQVEGHADRIAAQSDLLSRRAEGDCAP